MKPLTEQQRERVAKVIAAITKERTALDGVMNKFSGNAAEYLPVPTQKRVEIVTKQAEMVLAELAVVAAPDWEGSFKELIGRTIEAKTELQNATRSLKVYAEEARTAMTELTPYLARPRPAGGHLARPRPAGWITTRKASPCERISHKHGVGLHHADGQGFGLASRYHSRHLLVGNCRLAIRIVRRKLSNHNPALCLS